jgi:type VI protein secretion system component VasK
MIVSDPARVIAAATIVAIYLAFCVLVFWRHRRKRRSPPRPERVASPVRRGPIVEARGKIAAITLANQLPERGRLDKRRR